jgi:hypothetical protein
MFRVIWEFLTDKQTFMVATKVLVSVLAVALVDDRMDAAAAETILEPILPVAKILAYPIVGLTAATGKKKKGNNS